MGTLSVPLGWIVLLDRLLECQSLGRAYTTSTRKVVQAKRTLERISVERGCPLLLAWIGLCQ